LVRPSFMTKPASNYMIYFSQQEIVNMKQEATQEIPDIRISFLDILLSNICCLIHQSQWFARGCRESRCHWIPT
jgi:hypothetical protein